MNAPAWICVGLVLGVMTAAVAVGWLFAQFVNWIVGAL